MTTLGLVLVEMVLAAGVCAAATPPVAQTVFLNPVGGAARQTAASLCPRDWRWRFRHLAVCVALTPGIHAGDGLGH
jgi:hypothetical protein